RLLVANQNGVGRDVGVEPDYGNIAPRVGASATLPGRMVLRGGWGLSLDLSQYRMTDYVFSWDKMLALHGNTAPYLQNAYVRIRSIFRKADVAVPLSWGGANSPRRGFDRTGDSGQGSTVTLAEPTELDLAKRLCQFAEIAPQVLNDFRTNILANYLFELANSFHAFYEACPVLKAEEPARLSRLALCDLTGRVLRRGLKLLGIEVPERM
ncbi:MAG TPA: DALR anticodon-binding domain-containing protein, partial [Chthoniobacterales bacterium]|nr:DALR anticodon-binding domain-containing protein [Chthoniobacterales bacterium]